MTPLIKNFANLREFYARLLENLLLLYKLILVFKEHAF